MSAGADTKIHSIQLLRGLAALSVAVVHLWFGFASYVDRRDAAPPWSDTLSQAAVAAFFVISGAVMVISSRQLFGSARGTVRFWRRRAVRVLPPYWLATLLFAGVALWLGLPAEPGFVARSLVFIPPDSPTVPFLPFLWPGWTLFYELAFYVVFGAFVFAGRAYAVALTALVLVGLVVAGAVWRGDSYLAVALTRPVLLLFVAGLGAGLLFDAGRTAPLWLRALAAAAAPAMLAFGPAPREQLIEFDWLAWAGVPGLLLFLAVAGGPIPPRLARLSSRFGDISYAIYLLHIPFAHAWMQVFNVWMPHPGGSLGYMAAGLPLLLVLSFAFHRWVERPVSGWLNARLA